MLIIILLILMIYNNRHSIIKRIKSAKTKLRSTKFLVVLFAGLMMMACSPQKRLQRLIRKHPELIQTDTLAIRDTIVSKSIQIDTTYAFNGTTDTILLENERLKVAFKT